MNWKVVVWLIQLSTIVTSSDNNQIVSDFFNRPIECNNQKGSCISKSQICAKVTNDDVCGSFLICCDNAPSKEPDNGFVFPTRPTPGVRTPTTTTSTTTRRTTTRTTSTTTITTEEPLDPNYVPPDCGVRQSKMDHSEPLEDAEPGEFPWNVGIFTVEQHPYRKDATINVFHCGGTLIDDFVVLTAASCVKRKNVSSLYVFAGLWNTTDSQEKKRQIRQVREVVTHPRFQLTSNAYDIAFIYMDDKVDFSPTVNRICLPEPGVDFQDSHCFVTGWGSTSGDENKVRPILKTADVRLLPASDCEKRLQRRVYEGRFILNKSFQCTEEEGSIIGKWDLGSPLICSIPGQQNQFYQAGIFSYKLQASAPSVFTNVTMFWGWINERMKAFDRHPYRYTPQVIEDEENDDGNE